MWINKNGCYTVMPPLPDGQHVSFCFLYNIVSENHSVQNSTLGGLGSISSSRSIVYTIPKIFQVCYPKHTLFFIWPYKLNLKFGMQKKLMWYMYSAVKMSESGAFLFLELGIFSNLFFLISQPLPNLISKLMGKEIITILHSKFCLI